MSLLEFFKTELKLKKSLMPAHIGLYLRDGNATPAVKTRQLQQLIYAQTRLGVPVLSIYALAYNMPSVLIPTKADDLADLAQTLLAWKFVQQASIRVHVLGHWYDLPGRLVEPLTRLQEATRHN